METESSGAAVVPVTGALTPAGTSTELEPWRMLADGTGMLVAWEPAPSGVARWGATLAASSGLARQLVTVVERAGSKLPTAGETLFRLELPAGQTVSNLIPAVGGGFRGMTRLAGSTKIANQARLLPVGGAAAGAAVALGPLLGLVALSVGADMLASRQQEAKLEAIKQVVERLENHELNELIAALDSAEHVLEDSMAALLDRLDVPEAVGLGPDGRTCQGDQGPHPQLAQEVGGGRGGVRRQAEEAFPSTTSRSPWAGSPSVGSPPSVCRCSSPTEHSPSTPEPTLWR